MTRPITFRSDVPQLEGLVLMILGEALLTREYSDKRDVSYDQGHYFPHERSLLSEAEAPLPSKYVNGSIS